MQKMSLNKNIITYLVYTQLKKEEIINISSEIVFHNEIVGKTHSRLCRKSQ